MKLEVIENTIWAPEIGFMGINVRVGINHSRSDHVTLRDTGTGNEPTFFNSGFGTTTGTFS